MTLRAYRVGTTVMRLHTIHAYGCEVHPEEDLREGGYGSRLQSAELLSRELFPIGPLGEVMGLDAMILFSKC